MLDDPRSQALVDNFAGQWLYLRNLEVSKPTRRFKEFDDSLRQHSAPRPRSSSRTSA